MIQPGDELKVATGAGQSHSAPSSLLNDITNSRVNYYAAYVADFSSPVLFGYLGLRHHATWLSTIVSLMFGLALFTLVEYVVHRWLLHDPRSALFSLHHEHHLRPEEPAAGFFLTNLSILISVWLLLTYGLHLQNASFFLCGFSAGNFYFATLHNLEHSVRINQIPFRWLQGRWAAHSVHHRIDGSNFGVITSFWDYVFRTHQKQIKRNSLTA